MQISRIAAFADNNIGGNPAGVAIADQLPAPEAMQSIAADVGFSETVFAAPDGDGWQVRYYSPQTEVAFCGHATIALGVELGRRYGAGTYALYLAKGSITVSAIQGEANWFASLQSPQTHSTPLSHALTNALLSLFDLTADDLDPRFPPTLAFAGVNHAVLAVRTRETLARMAYDFEDGLDLMAKNGLTTISLLYIQSETAFVARNAFAIGGVVEDAATGAAAAALGGALVDLDWPTLSGGGTFTIRQGEDMGQPSELTVTVTGTPHESVRVSGAARDIT